MPGIFGSLFKRSATLPSRANGINVNTSIYGKPIPLVYGKTRVSGNLLEYGNFNSVQNNSASGGGKGFGNNSGANATQGNNYFAAVALALSEGPINSVNTVWYNKQIHTPGHLGFSLFTGTFPQTGWSQQISWNFRDVNNNLISGSNSTAVTYNGVAYLANSNLNLGQSPDLPNFQFEVTGLLSSASTGSTGGDLDPSAVLTDVLSNVNHGLGFTSSAAGAATGPRIGDLSSWQNYCFAQGLFISPAYDTQRTGADIIDELGVATNSAPLWVSGQLTMVPYGEVTLTANGKTFTAPVSQFSLTDNDFMLNSQGSAGTGGASAPVVLERKRASDKTNSVKIEYLDRKNAYAPSVAYANDQALIDVYGLRSNGSKQMHLFCASSAANTSAHLQLRRLARISNTYFFDLDQRYVLLDPMDVVTLTDSNLGLSSQPVRILEIQENDDGTFSYKAEEFLGTVSAPQYNFGAGAGYNTNPATTPGSTSSTGSVAGTIAAPIIFEPPFALISGSGNVNTGQTQLWFAICSNDPTWGGAQVWGSVDGSNFSLFGTIRTNARMGILTAPLNPYGAANPDSVDTLAVDMSASGGSLVTGSSLSAQAGNSLALIDNELLSYQTATLTAANKYNLTTLYRGLYGSTAAQHSTASATFLRLDDAILKLPIQAQFLNFSLRFKFLSFNNQNGGLQALSDVPTYTYNPTGRGTPHPLAQALSFSNTDSGLITQSVSAVDDYGFVVSRTTLGTPNYYPVAIDLGGFVSSFSLSLAAASSQFLTLSGRTASAGAQGRKFTVHLFMLRASVGTQAFIWTLGLTQTNVAYISFQFNTSNQLVVSIGNLGTLAQLTTTQTVADTTNWHEVILSVDTSQAVATNRVKIILDSTTCTLTGTFPTQNTAIVVGTYGTVIGSPSLISAAGTSTSFSTGAFFDGKIAEYYYIDNQQLASSDFSVGGISPIQFAGPLMGVYDQYLNFLTSTNMGQDYSGENNSFTLNSVSSANQSTAYP